MGDYFVERDIPNALSTNEFFFCIDNVSDRHAQIVVRFCDALRRLKRREDFQHLEIRAIGSCNLVDGALGRSQRDGDVHGLARVIHVDDN